MNLQLVYRYILSLSKKWKYVCENNKKQKQKDPKKKEKKKFLSARVEPGPTDVEGIYNATTSIEHPR